MKLIDKDKIIAELEKLIEIYKKCPTRNNYEDGYKGGRLIGYEDALYIINTLEVKDVIAEQECTCNEALNRIIGGSWNLLCPVNKLWLKTGDKVKVIIEAQKGE